MDETDTQQTSFSHIQAHAVDHQYVIDALPLPP